MSFWASFLGSGIAVAILNWLFSSQAKRIEREASFLEKQLKEVYGPVYLFVSHGRKLFELVQKHEELAEKYLKTGQGGLHDDRIMDASNASIKIQNEYVRSIREDGNLIRQILTASYYLVDNDDFDLFQRFLLDYKRLDVEFEKDGMLKTSLRIYNDIDPPHFLDLKLAEQIESKFRNKQERLGRLSEESSRFTINIRDLWKASRGAISKLVTKLLSSSR